MTGKSPKLQLRRRIRPTLEHQQIWLTRVILSFSRNPPNNKGHFAFLTIFNCDSPGSRSAL